MKKTIQTPVFQKLLKEFESYVKVRNYKQGKGTMNKGAVIEFLVWLEVKGVTNIKEVTSKEMVSYFEYLIERPNQRREGTLAEKTIKSHLYVLGLFMQNLLESKVIDTGFYIPSYSDGFSKSRNFLSVEQIKMVYAHCQNDLERALLSVAYGCGLRRCELEQLSVKDVFLSSGELIVRKGKGSKRRTIPVSNTMIDYIKKYILEERPRRLLNSSEIQEAFFINSKGNRMSGEHLNETLKKMIEVTNNQELIKLEITLHCLRHSIASHLADNNAGIEFIRRFLGHQEINTAYIYAIKNKKRKPVTNF